MFNDIKKKGGEFSVSGVVRRYFGAVRIGIVQSFDSSFLHHRGNQNYGCGSHYNLAHTPSASIFPQSKNIFHHSGTIIFYAWNIFGILATGREIFHCVGRILLVGKMSEDDDGG